MCAGVYAMRGCMCRRVGAMQICLCAGMMRYADMRERAIHYAIILDGQVCAMQQVKPAKWAKMGLKRPKIGV